ncbi:MAG: type I methionyl aminopeptidase [Chitinophagaceae bacterium]|nr:type I methionyl aminopeptidase [Chitinophagaceae bacterium]
MIYYKTNDEVELLRKSNLLVSATIAVLAAEIKPGVTTLFLDKLAGEFIQDNGAKPAFKGYRGFPYNCCISVNDAVVHGFPTHDELAEGDVISIDTGVVLNGYVGDSAYTFAIGEVDKEIQRLMRITKESLYKGIEKAIVGCRIGDISWAIQEHTEKKNGYGVVRSLTGHGIGRNLHEEPDVPNYGKRGNGLKLQDGLVIAIEPMINMGTREVSVGEDDWTIFTDDGSISAHYEHSVVVRKNKADILSSFDPIEAAEKANPNLFDDYLMQKELA